jgi:hypothetical protein
MNDPAIQNLEFIRQLIEEMRADESYRDMLRLRMLQGGEGGVNAEVVGSQ